MFISKIMKAMIGSNRIKILEIKMLFQVIIIIITRYFNSLTISVVKTAVNMGPG